MRRFLACLVLSLIIGSAYGQVIQVTPGPPVVTFPSNTGPAGTATTGGQLPLANGGLALTSNVNRKGCLIQNLGTHIMSVAVNSTFTNAISLPGEVNGLPSSLNCQLGGIVIGDPIYISGTTSDTVVIWWQ